MAATSTIRPSTYLVHVTARERETLLAHVEPSDALDDVFRSARVNGPLVCLELDADELDHFMDHLDQAAMGAQNEVAQNELGRALDRINAGFAGTVDPGWHMVRPAMVALGYSDKQGQYLAFIHAYTRLHRRPPAESDFQIYFGVTPPTVHEMLKALVRKGFISRRRGEPRSIRLLLQPHAIPELE
jgi:LexA DNA binding domain-containing protein